ncbi:hypothetical protein PQI66_03115 [Corynebacterium sp. USCH3]|uniref:hypothetical protein n=1 Tax=Corynebacterium sp. USCH3 TaxID=3024840 RepID=UPI00309E8DB1
MTIRRSALAALFVLPLVLTACGNDDQDPAPATNSATSSTASSTTSSITSSKPSATPEPEPLVEEPAAVEPVPEQQGIWAPPGQGTRCPGTDAYVWDYADCNPSNGVIDPEEFYRLTERTPEYEEPYRSDGCVGPAATCGYYDDNGDPIWFDKETGETSPRYYDENGNPTMEGP